MSEIEYTAPERALASAHPSIAYWSLDHIYRNPSGAAAAIEPLLRSPEFADDRASLAAAHFVLGAATAVLGKLARAEEHLDAAEALYAALGDELAIAHVTVRRDLVWHQREEFDHAFGAFPAALEVARKHEDSWLETAILSDLGMIHMRLGNIPDGVDSLFAALEVAQRGSDRMQETVIRMNLANTFIELHDFEVAAAWLEQCLAVARPFETDPIIFECTQSLAVCEEQLGRPQRALTLLDEAIALAERLEFPFGMAESSYDQGRLFLELGETKKATLAFERSLTNFRKMDIPAAQVRIAMCQWQLESISGEFTEPTYRTLVLCAEQGTVAPYARGMDLHDALARSAEALGMASEAVFHLRESRRLCETYWAQIAERQARVALKRYQLATAERAAELERSHREELARALDSAEKLNAENQALLEQLRSQSIILEQQATEDALTGIGNRRYFDVHLEREISRALDFERSISVALADIDNFKEINDTYSHRIGDDVLVAVGSVLRETLRPPVVVARYGGEEFAFIFPEAGAERAYALAEQVRIGIEGYAWASIVPDLTVTISMGLITRAGQVTPTQVISAADSLLYQAKRRGKNLVEHREINDEMIDTNPLFSGDRRNSWLTIP